MITAQRVIEGCEVTAVGFFPDEAEWKNYIDYCQQRVDEPVTSVKVTMCEDGLVDVSYSAHGQKFERIRRVTGYLVGTLDRWNDAKRAEEAERVKHAGGDYMTRPIKFRGRRIDNGKFVYGDFVHSAPMTSFPAIIDDEDKLHPVDPDSVAQLVDYDKDGREVYEGDSQTDDKGFEYEALLQAMVLFKPVMNATELADIPPESRTMPLDFVKRFTSLKLKEESA